MSMFQLWSPVWRQSNSAVERRVGRSAAAGERTPARRRSACRGSTDRQFGAAHEDRRRHDRGQDRQRVDAGIEDAEAARPPRSSPGPGCQRRTSSFHSMASARMRWPARRLARLVDGGIVLRMPGGEDDAACAPPHGRRDRSVPPWSGSAAFRAAHACRRRAPRGRWRSARSAACRSRRRRGRATAAKSSAGVRKVGTPGCSIPRWLTRPASLKSGFLAMTGRCWSCEILPTPMIAML